MEKGLSHVNASTASKESRPCFLPVHQLIEKHAQERPYSLAVRYNHQELSYSQLNKAANRLAHHLKAMDVGFEDRVMVCVEPSFSILIALLGILKAGAVYVPMEPTYPIARIKSIFKKIGPAAVISEKNLLSQLNLEERKLINLDKLPDTLSDEDLTDVPLSDQTAYIFNTSGSTGLPKAVVASHENLSYFMDAAIDRFSIDKSSVMPTLARFGFSISLFELLSPLVAGGTVLILDREHVLDPARLVKSLSLVTMFHAGPSLLKGIITYMRVHYSEFKDFEGVKHASSGGDAIPPDVLESLKQLFPKADIFVIYGATEIACMGCNYLVPRDRVVTKTYVGKPFSNTSLLVLDEHLNPVPLGVEGEVCFAGPGIAHGYLSQLEMTQERFCFLGKQRFYRTGDVGRLSDTKELELLGRLDFQIKIRGMRVELLEVEYQLRLAKGVKEAVVAAHDLGSGEKSLIAYVVLEDKAVKNIAALHSHLARQLPEYMIPVCYAFIDNLPLNFNLKLDRKALPDPASLPLHRVTGGAIRVLETATQKRLASLWGQLLGVGEVGLDDKFFELGGHSLVAIELLHHIKTTFGVTIDGMDVLRESLEVLALIIDQRLGQQLYKSNAVSPLFNQAVSVDSFYFGLDSSLYGVLYKPLQPVRKTLLICGPGQVELELSVFIIQQLARRLATLGIAVFQFHYYGTGDSAGDGAIEGLSRWHKDIVCAQNELKSRYPSCPMTGLGIRLGATLLWHERDKLGLDGIVFWDPIFDGKHYVKELSAQQHKRVSDLMYSRHYQPPRLVPGQLELLGTTYSDKAIQELQSANIDPSDYCHQTIHWILSTAITECPVVSGQQQDKPSEAMVQSVFHNATINWYLPNRKLPDTGISKLLADAVESL